MNATVKPEQCKTIRLCVYICMCVHVCVHVCVCVVELTLVVRYFLCMG